MTFQVLPLEHADLATYVRIHLAAFKEGISACLTTTTEASKAQMEAQQSQKLLSDATAHYLKVVDTQTGEIIACARWHLYNEERSAEEVARANALRPPPEGANVEAWNEFSGWLAYVRNTLVGGQKCWFLSTLVTDPVHSRRGAGSMLVQWGCERADRDSLPAYLEASSMSKPLYEKFGFKETSCRVFDLSKYGYKGTDHNSAMRRPAKGAPSERSGKCGLAADQDVNHVATD